MRLSHSLVALACLAALAACQPTTDSSNSETPASTPPPAAAEPTAQPEPIEAVDEVEQRLAAIIDGEHRKAEDRARDQYRHPLETLTFFDIQPDATVIEITPGGGWYTDILAPFLRPHGHLVAAIWDESLPDQPAYYARLNTALEEKIAAAPDVYGEVELRRFNPAEPEFGAPGTADMVLTFRNIHNWVPAGTAEAYFKAFYDVLKPGGILGTVDHRAKGDEATDGSSGYLTEQQVIALAEGAGFELADRSEVNANPADTADHAKGVWTLPPTFALGDEDREKYAEIGESDRMTLKFVKPVAPATEPVEE